MKKYIPNIITLINLFSGCCALVSVFSHQYMTAIMFIFIGIFADVLDGLIARSLGINSPLGKELDSFADMVSFGIVPGAILYNLLAQNFTPNEFPQLIPAATPAFLVTVFAGLRLAKFNLDTRQSDNFIGLPTPSCTVFIAGLLMIFHYDSFGLSDFVTSPYFLYPVILLLSFLLVAELPMFSLKFKGMQWKGNEIRIVFILLGLGLLFIIKEASFSIIISLYIIFAIIKNFFNKSAV